MEMRAIEARPQDIQLNRNVKKNIAPQHLNIPSTAPIVENRAKPQAMTSSAYSSTKLFLLESNENITRTQIATQSLSLVARELHSIRNTLVKHIQSSSIDSKHQIETLSTNKNNLSSILKNSVFNGVPVLDNQLNLNLSDTQTSQFFINGLNINRMKEKAEQVKLELPNGKALIIQFDGKTNGQNFIKQLDKSLISLGMRASLSDDGNIVFKVKGKIENIHQQKVMVTGQGHRFPAGAANAFSIQEEPQGIAQLKLDISNTAGIKKSLEEVNGFLLKAQQSSEVIKKIQQKHQLNPMFVEPSYMGRNNKDVNQLLNKLSDKRHDFSNTFELLNVQANVKRQSVLALLKY